MNEKLIHLLKAQLESTPGDLDIIIPLIQQYASSENYALAIETLASAEVDDQSEFISALLSEVDQCESTSPQLAIIYLDRILQENKALAEAYLRKATIYHRTGEKELALKNYNVAVVIDESLENLDFENTLENDTTDHHSSSKKIALPSSHSASPEQGIPEREMLTADDDFVDNDFAEADRLLDSLADGLPNINFSDIGGMDNLKERIRMSIIYPFKNKELFAKFKKKTGGGILMYGPPGCGKTFISRATAGECGAHYMDISIHEILSKWIGEAEQRIHQIFETARRKSPSIIFIDEIDALCIKRSDAGNSASLVNALLTEIDGASFDNENVLVIGATNTPWRIDTAFRRPGRFDHVLFVPPPDALARAAIFELALKDIPQEKINLGKLGKYSEKFSGADIVACVQSAAEAVINSILQTGKDSLLTEKMLLQSIKKHRATTLEWIEQASNYASFANQSGLYDDLSDYLKTI
ncbi:MAG: AAA family ATPase [Akkermansiaceae bacterium]